MMTQPHDENAPIAIPYDALKSLAGTVAAEMKAAGATLPAEVRARFVNVRAALFQRGIFDPVLVRLDSATAPRATVAEVAAQLETVAASL